MPAPEADPTPSARPQRPRRLDPLHVTGGISALAFIAGIAYLALRPAPLAKAQTLKPKAVRVVVTTLRAADSYTERRTHTGRVEAPRISRIGGEIGGTLLEVLVDEGQFVAAQQPIARFDTKRLAAQRLQRVADQVRQEAILAELRAGPRAEDIRAQKAHCRRADAAAALAKATANRMRKARDEDAVSDQEWDDARLRSEQAAAAADAARATLAELEAGTRTERIAAQVAAVEALTAAVDSLDVDIAKGTLVAPFAARVTHRLAEPGQVLAPGAPTLELREVPAEDSKPTDLSGRPEIRVGVLPALARSLEVGQTVPVRIRNRPSNARILAIRSDQSARTRTVPILLTVEPEEGRPAVELGDGELVEVVFERTISQPGLWVPATALSEGVRGLWRCLVLTDLSAEGDAAPDDATHRLATRVVEIVHFDEQRAYVRGTLKPGDRIVRDGAHRLVPGLAVRAAGEDDR